MLQHFQTYNKTLRAMLFILSTTVLVRCISPVSPDTIRDGISIDEAQKLLPFRICLPEFVPNGINISETVRYHDEFGDPYESDVTIDYFGTDKVNPVLTIYERHGPGGTLDFYDHTLQRVSMRRLMDWQIDSETPKVFEEQIDELDENGVIEYRIYTFDTERLIVEIKSPKDLKAVLITWKLSENELVDIYSRLSVEETKLVANSVTNCIPEPKMTP